MEFETEDRGRTLTAAEELAVSSLQRLLRKHRLSPELSVEAESADLHVRVEDSRPFAARRRRHWWDISDAASSIAIPISVDAALDPHGAVARDRVVISDDSTERSARMVSKVVAEARKRSRFTIAAVAGWNGVRSDCDELFHRLAPADLVRLIGGARCVLEPAGAEDGQSLEAVVAVALGIPVITHVGSSLQGAWKVAEWSSDAFFEAIAAPFEKIAPPSRSDEDLARWLAQR